MADSEQQPLGQAHAQPQPLVNLVGAAPMLTRLTIQRQIKYILGRRGVQLPARLGGRVFRPRGPSLASVSSRVEEELYSVACSYAQYTDPTTLDRRVACTIIAFIV